MSLNNNAEYKRPPFVLDGSEPNRRPSTPEARKLINWLLHNHNKATHIEEIAQTIHISLVDTRFYCRHLEMIGMAVEEPQLSLNYRYNVNCWDIELQREVEVALLE